MYLPREYWRRLETDPAIEGKNQGRAVTFDNVGRHFNNTTFADLVAGGWIGTSGMQTSALDSLVREIIGRGRTVTIAVKEQSAYTAFDDFDDEGDMPVDVPILQPGDILDSEE